MNQRFSKELMEALEADGEKLRQLTGQDHGPYMTDAPDPYTRWCERHGVTHGHCPNDCEHPQPWPDGEDMRCSFCHAAMIPCTPEACE